MRNSFLFGIAISLIACGGSDDDGSVDLDAAAPDAPDVVVDAPVDGPPVECTGLPARVPWSNPQVLSVQDHPDDVSYEPTLSPDRLEIFMSDWQGAGVARATRASVNDDFGPAEPVFELDFGNGTPDSRRGSTPRLSPDGLTLYLTGRWPVSDRVRIHRRTRTEIGGTWSEPEAMTELDVGSQIDEPGSLSACASGDQLVFHTAGPQGSGVYEARNGQLRRLDELTAGNTDPFAAPFSPFVSADCLSLYFASRSGGLQVSRRPTPAHAWCPPEPMTEVESTTGYSRGAPWVSADGQHLVLQESFFNPVEHTISGSKLIEFSR